MPVTVSMHACSAWPVSIDFAAFRFFLQGYSVEETVEQLMALQSVAARQKPGRQRSFSASSSPSSDLANESPNNSAASSSPSASHAGVSPPLRSRHARRHSSASGSTKRKPSAPGNPDSKTNAPPAEMAPQTEDTRMGEEQMEELLPAGASTAPTTDTAAATVSLDKAEKPPTTTTVDTSTNTTTAVPTTHPTSLSRPSHSSQHRHDSHSATSALPQSKLPQQSIHHHHHSHARHHHGSSGNTRDHHTRDASPAAHKKKQHHSAMTLTQSSSRQRTANVSVTNTATASFALPPMGSYDNLHSSSTANVNRAGGGGGESGLLFLSSPQSCRHSMDDTVAAAAAATAAAAAPRGTNANKNMPENAKKTSSSRQRHARHKKRGHERQSFFLNEDYMRFQRRLQEEEAVGGVGMGASSLQSRYLYEEVTEQFQAFRELAREEQLGSPYAFLSNYYVPIPVATRLELLRLFYETDPGVFRWAFGDKLNRFDLPAALSAVQEEALAGSLSGAYTNRSAVHGGAGTSGSGGAGAGNLGAGAAGNANAGGGGGGALSTSFWSSRWKSSPGKLATMDSATVLRLSEQNAESLRRQWENVKHVCATVAALYRGKGGMCVPLDMPLLTTIQQCFGLRQEQALDYATAAFGFEHRLETRLFDRLPNFSEYGAVCSVVASLWCDESQFFLSEPFRNGCRRLGRLLDEYRILSELHLYIFGEAMRPRWQVQLDEVQRVITTSSLVDKNTVAGSPVGSAASPSLSANAGNSSGVFGSGGNIGAGGGAGWDAAGGLNSSNSCNTAAGAAAGGDAAGAGASPTNGGNNTNVHSPFSGNGQYSRRFLLEFPSLMKHLFRVCVALGNNGGVNDALDVFYTRVYSYLELLSSRTAPALVSMVLNAAAAPGGLVAAAGVGPAVVGIPAIPGSFAGAAADSATSAAHGRPPLPPGTDRSRSNPDTVYHTVPSHGQLSPPPPPMSGPTSPLRMGSGSKGAGLPKASSSPSFSQLHSGNGGRRRGYSGDAGPPPAISATATCASESRATSSGPDDMLAPSASFPYAVSSVVNTSLFHPASALIPLSAAIAAHNNAVPATASFASAPSTAVGGSRVFGGEGEELPEWSEDGGSGGTGTGQHSGGRPAYPSLSAAAAAAAAVGGGSAGAASSLFSSQMSDIVRKAVDKRYLRELCMLLTALPKAWRQMTSPTTEDHTVTDKAMSDLAMALKAITQVLMASDDFH